MFDFRFSLKKYLYDLDFILPKFNSELISNLNGLGVVPKINFETNFWTLKI